MSKYSPIGLDGRVNIYAANKWAQHKASKQPNSVVSISSKRLQNDEVVPSNRSGHVLARLAHGLRGHRKANPQSGQCALGALRAAIEREQHGLGDKAADWGKRELDLLAHTFAGKDIPMASLALVLRDTVDRSLAERCEAAKQAKVIENRAKALACRRESFVGPDTMPPLEGLSASLQFLESDYRKSLDDCARYKSVDEMPGPTPLPATANPSTATLVKTQNALKQLAYMTTLLGAAIKKPGGGARSLRFQLLDEELGRLLGPIQRGLKGEQLGELVHQRLARCRQCWLAIMKTSQHGPLSASNAREQFQMEVESTIAELSKIGGALVESAAQDPLQDGLRRCDRAALFELGQLFLQVAYLLAEETGALVQAHGAACSMGQLTDQQLRRLTQQRPVEKVIPPIAPPAVLNGQPSNAQPGKGQRRLPRRYQPDTRNPATVSRAYTTVRSQLGQQQTQGQPAAAIPFQPLVKHSVEKPQNRRSAPPGLTEQQLVQREQRDLLQPQLTDMEQEVFLSPRKGGPNEDPDAELKNFLEHELRPLSGPDSPHVISPPSPTETKHLQPPTVPSLGRAPSKVEDDDRQHATARELQAFLDQLENDPASIAPINLDGDGLKKNRASYLPVRSTEPNTTNTQDRRPSRGHLKRVSRQFSSELNKVKRTITG